MFDWERKKVQYSIQFLKDMICTVGSLVWLWLSLSTEQQRKQRQLNSIEAEVHLPCYCTAARQSSCRVPACLRLAG